MSAQEFVERIIDTPTAPWAVFAVDLDRDGDVDVISGDGGGLTAQATLYWYENDGNVPPTFERRFIDRGRDTSSIHAADIDADGDVDIVVGTSAQGQINWFENDGAPTPTFSRHLVDGSASFNRDVHVADVDGDGHVDILAATNGAFRFAVYSSDGASPPTFTRSLTWPASFPVAIRGADLDRDGDTDLILADHLRSGTVWWQENLGDKAPGFVEHTVGTGIGRPHGVAPTDLDADGDVDILVASTDDDTIAWYENDGLLPPSFSRHVISTNARAARSVFAADVDGDGDTDVLSASESDRKVAWYENDGTSPPGFTEHIITNSPDGPREVFAVDLEADGDMDVLWVAVRDDTLAWHEQVFALGVSGPCGGTASLKVTGAPPDSEVGAIAATERTGFTKSGPLCGGTRFEIGGVLQLPPLWIPVNEAGYGSATMSIGTGACWLEAIALASCETSGAIGTE